MASSRRRRPARRIADAEKVAAIARKRAKRFIAFDMQRIADENGSVISASLFGALAGAQVLPFAREEFEATIRHGGKGIEPSLEAFGAGCDSVTLAETGLIGLTPTKSARTPPVEPAGGSEEELRQYGLAVERTKSLPYEAAAMALAGFRHAVDFQDVAYGYEYLDRLSEILAFDRDRGGLGRSYALTREMAKYLARAMVYDDVIRVADLKTRAKRLARVRAEAGAGDAEVVRVTEFMHPRMEEICGTMPARWGRWIEARPRLFADARPRLQPRPPRAHQLALLVHGALSARRPEAAPAARSAATRSRRRISTRGSTRSARRCRSTTISPSRS